jgi:carbon storage regulator
MLVLSRQKDESVMIGDRIEVTIIDVRGDKVRLGINYPKEIAVHRKEIYDVIQREKAQNSEEKTINDKVKEEVYKTLWFRCSGTYNPDLPKLDVYLRVYQSGKKKLSCERLNAEGYCSFPLSSSSEKCPFGIEKFL